MVAGGDLLESVEAQAASKKPPEGHEMPLGTCVCVAVYVFVCVLCVFVCVRESAV